MGAAEWIALAALAVGIVVLPTVFQMIWGHPYITFAFNRLEDQRDSLLLVHLYNLPITNRLLARIGVARTDAHFHVTIRIRDSSGNQLLRYTEPPVSAGDPFKQNLIHLHAGPSPATLEILGANTKYARVYMERRADSFHEYVPGTYRIRLEVWVAERMFFEERSFVVTANFKNSYWADS